MPSRVCLVDSRALKELLEVQKGTHKRHLMHKPTQLFQVDCNTLILWTFNFVNIRFRESQTKLNTTRTFVAKCLCDNETSEKSSEDKNIHMDLLIPLVVLAICFLLSLAVIIYQSRRHQNSYRMASHKGKFGTYVIVYLKRVNFIVCLH